MSIGFSGITTAPDDEQTIRAYTIIKEDFVGIDVEPVLIVIPIKTIILNLLSVFTAYGLITRVFQHGVGVDLLGFRHN